jgi:hypothetical protein
MMGLGGGRELLELISSRLWISVSHSIRGEE